MSAPTNFIDTNVVAKLNDLVIWMPTNEMVVDESYMAFTLDHH